MDLALGDLSTSSIEFGLGRFRSAECGPVYFAAFRPMTVLGPNQPFDRGVGIDLIASS